MELYEKHMNDETFARMMIDAYDTYGDYMNDYYYATRSLALDLLLDGEIVALNGKLIKLASKRLVKLYNPETRDFT